MKAHPFVRILPGETVTLADIKGPGCINEMFFTTNAKFYSELLLRVFWDDEEEPSAETPVGGFFANGFDDNQHFVNSVPVVVLPRNSISTGIRTTRRLPTTARRTISAVRGAFGNTNTARYQNDEHTYSTPFLGMPLALTWDTTKIRKYSLYRWHVFDSTGFFKDVRVPVDTIGLKNMKNSLRSPPRGKDGTDRNLSRLPTVL